MASVAATSAVFPLSPPPNILVGRSQHVQGNRESDGFDNCGSNIGRDKGSCAVVVMTVVEPAAVVAVMAVKMKKGEDEIYKVDVRWRQQIMEGGYSDGCGER